MKRRAPQRVRLGMALLLVLLASAGSLVAQQKLSTTIYFDYSQYLTTEGYRAERHEKTSSIPSTSAGPTSGMITRSTTG